MKLNAKNILFASTALCCLQTASFSEQFKLDSITVEESTFNENIKSITAEKLENSQASDVKDILKYIPSVVVDGNARYSQKVYVRGLEDKFSNITIDGAKLEGQLFHHSGDQTIDAEMLKIGSIELGPNSALSGAGVVNASFKYETKDPSDFLKDGEKIGMNISTGYQSAYSRKSTKVAVFTKINDKLEFLALGNLTKDGSIKIPDQSPVKSKQSTLKSGLFKFVIKPNEYNTIKLNYNKYSDGGDRQLSGEKPGNSKTDNTKNEIVRDTYSIDYKYTPENELVDISANVYSNTQKLDRGGSSSVEKNILKYDIEDQIWALMDGNAPDKDAQIAALRADANNYADLTDSRSAKVYENKTSGFDLRNTSVLDNHTLTYGADYYKVTQKVKADGDDTTQWSGQAAEVSNASANGGEIIAYGVYLEDEIDLDRLVLNIGARYDNHKLGGSYKGTFTDVTPKFKASYQATSNLTLRMGYGKIFKGPVLGETLMVRNKMVQADNTKAQTGQNIEFGFDYNLSSMLNADSSKIGFTTYKYNLDNQMHPTKNTRLTSNTDVEMLGFETMFVYKKDKFGFNLSHTYIDGESKDQTSGLISDSDTSNIHTFKVGSDYQVSSNLNVSYDAEFVPSNKKESKYKDNNVVTNETAQRKGYAVHNISSVYKVESLKGAKLYFGIDNLFDKKYSRHTGFGTSWGDSSYTSFEPGRNYKIKLSYTF